MTSNAQNHRQHRQRKESDEAIVSEVIGAGELARREVTIGSWRFVAMLSEGIEPRIADSDIMDQLEYPSGLRKFRQRIRDIAAITPEFRPLANRTQRVRFTADGQARGSVPVAEYLLSERDALFLVTKISTPKADELTFMMVDVFRVVVKTLGGDAERKVRLLEVENTSLHAQLNAATMAANDRDFASGTIGPRKAHNSIVVPIRNIATQVVGERGTPEWISYRAKVESTIRNACGFKRAWKYLPDTLHGDVAGRILDAAAMADAIMRPRKAARQGRLRVVSL
jgi:hypothetical protein